MPDSIRIPPTDSIGILQTVRDPQNDTLQRVVIPDTLSIPIEPFISHPDSLKPSIPVRQEVDEMPLQTQELSQTPPPTKKELRAIRRSIRKEQAAKRKEEKRERAAAKKAERLLRKMAK